MNWQQHDPSHDVSVMLAAILLVVFLAAPQTAAQEPDAKRNVVNAWRTRQARLKSASFNWQETRSETLVGDKVEVSLEKTLLLSGNKVRYSFGGLRPRDDGKFVSQTFGSVFDGLVSKSLHAPNESRNFPAGFVSKGDSAGDVMHTLPIRWWYRPMNAETAGFEAHNLTALPQTTIIDEQRYTVLATETNGKRSTRRMLFAVSPEQDYAIKRCTVEHNGTATRQYDVQYSKDENHGWVPTGWTISLLGGSSRVTDRYQAVVTAYEVNPSLADSHFQLQFPSGTMVADKSSGELVDYLTRASGEKRVIQQSEYSASYDELAATPSGAAFTGRKLMRITLIIVATTAAALAILAFALWSWRHKETT